MVETTAIIVALIIALALFFDFTNGFHDTANAMATPIATGALRPKVAVALAAVLNLVGAFLSTEVSKTISHGIIREDSLSGAGFLPIVFAGLIGAIAWNMFTWLLGLPSSSSHALFGGLIGATLIGASLTAIDFGVVLSKVVLPALIAPFSAGVIAFVATRVAYGVTQRHDGGPTGRESFTWGQIFSSALVALAHGTNDAQKTMGVITLALVTVGWQDSAHAEPQFWVVIACAGTIGHRLAGLRQGVRRRARRGGLDRPVLLPRHADARPRRPGARNTWLGFRESACGRPRERAAARAAAVVEQPGTCHHGLSTSARADLRRRVLHPVRVGRDRMAAADPGRTLSRAEPARWTSECHPRRRPERLQRRGDGIRRWEVVHAEIVASGAG